MDIIINSNSYRSCQPRAQVVGHAEAAGVGERHAQPHQLQAVAARRERRAQRLEVGASARQRGAAAFRLLVEVVHQPRAAVGAHLLEKFSKNRRRRSGGRESAAVGAEGKHGVLTVRGLGTSMLVLGVPRVVPECI